ncbi:MAG: hypothetical protein WA465_06890 [Methylovirgula sp.]
MTYEQAQKLFEFLTDKGLGVEDISAVYDIVKPAVEATDEGDIEEMPPPPKALMGGVPIQERKAMA